jgi:hypothetical protein
VPVVPTIIPHPDHLAIRISRRRRIAHAELVSVSKGHVRAGLSQFGEELPGNRGLADS